SFTAPSPSSPDIPTIGRDRPDDLSLNPVPIVVTYGRSGTVLARAELMQVVLPSPAVLRITVAVLAVLPLRPLAASAQSPTAAGESSVPAPGKVDALKEHEKKLEALRDEQRRTLENEARLKREIEAIADDRRKFNEQLIESAARVTGVEERIAQGQERV